MVGINVQNINILDTKFICHICSLIIQHPLQIITCGHRFCQSCLQHNNQNIITCPQCQTQTTTHEIMTDRAFNKELQLLPLICYFCQWNGILSNYQTHLEQTHPHPQYQPITCECVLKEFGCDPRIARDELVNHYASIQHQKSIIKVIEQMKSKSRGVQMAQREEDNEDEIKALEELYESINIMENGVTILKSDIDMRSGEVVEHETMLQSLVENMSKLKLSIEEEIVFLEATKQNIGILKQEVMSLEEKIDDLQHVSDDGIYTWKIKGVDEKMNDARSERQTSIYSPPFYSSPTGYKMRARLYLHGDGNARRTHMSLFFVLMRGPNDAVLKFPFNYKVTFCLYDQTPQQRHIIDSFRPDIKSNSFQRPRSEMNIASGIPKFFPLKLIEEEGNPYVRDDSMFIRIMVDFNDLPKRLVPYALSLNPALPTYAIQAMIKEEERHTCLQNPQSQQSS